MKLDKFEYINESETISSSNKMILNIINDLMKFNDKILSQVHINIISDPSRERKKSCKHSIHVNRSTLEIIDINNSEVNHLCELLNLLKNIKDLNLLMDYETYEKFRYKFTNLYFRAFFDDNDERSYAFDTDEINRIFKFRRLECEIIPENINGVIFYRLIDKKEKVE